MIAGHCRCANDNHHRSHGGPYGSSPSDSKDGDSEGRGRGESAATTEIGPGSDECTIEQRVALLCCLRAIASNNDEQFKILMDPEFLQQRFRDLLVDDNNNKTIIRFAVFYSCNKILPECHALARNHGVAELEHQVGKLEAYVDDHDTDDDGDENEGGDDDGDCPFEVAGVSADEAQHFVLSRNQWKQLCCEEGCVGCPRHMSVFTYYNRDSVDVSSILNAMVSF